MRQYDPQKHPFDYAQDRHRRSIRLQGYDYSHEGAYYLTIVTQQRMCLFGEVVGEEMRLNAAGQMIARWWLELAHKFPTVSLDHSVLMPNHFHGIVVLHDVGADLRVGPGVRAKPAVSTDNGVGGLGDDGYIQQGAHPGAPLPTIPTIVQWFKTMTTNEYIREVKQSGWQRFEGKLWQRNYYEHIVRDDEDYNRIYNYIEDNPANWVTDEENPAK